MSDTTPVRYAPDVEVEAPDEADVIAETVATMRHTMQQTFEKVRHQTSGTHAKSHGIATGRLVVDADLPPELAQSMFATPGEHEVVVRFASEPGAVDPDTVKRARGLALKVLDVRGEKLREGWTSQDFLFNTWPSLPQGDAATYLKVIKARDEHFDQHGRVVATTALRHPSLKETWFDRTPNINPVAHTYYSQAAFRYGDHIAKFAVVPVAPEQLALTDTEAGKDDPPHVLRDWLHDHFTQHPVRFEFRVQLCTDLDAMPVEDASKVWDEDASPYRRVAVLELPVQETFSPARRVFAEDVMSWRPMFGRVDLRPLGSINRVRRAAYEQLGEFRHQQNDRVEVDPRTLADVPD